MASMKERIIELLRENGSLSDREITDILVGKGVAQQPINQTCRDLESQGIIVRSKMDGRIKNFLANIVPLPMILASNIGEQTKQKELQFIW